MWSLRNIPIKRKLTLVVMMTSSTALVLACAALFLYQFKTFQNTLEQELETLARIIGANSTAVVNLQLQSDANEVLSALKENQHLVGACIYLEDGSRFAEYVRPGAKPDFDAKPRPDGHYGSRDHLTYFGPILDEKSEAGAKRRIGTISLQSDFIGLRESLNLYGGIVALVLLASILGALMLTARLQRFISEPILALADAARAVSERKDYSVRAAKTSADELGVFTEAFNHMLAQIQEQDAALHKANEELEKRVHERTQELESQIAERKRAEEALSVSEVRFRSLVQSANDAIVLADWQARIISWNQGARNMFGYEEREVLGQPLSRIMPERYRESHRQGLERFRTTGETHVIGKTVELHGLRKNGSEFPLELNLSTWKTSEGTFFSGIIRNITERKQAEQKLAQQAQELARSNSELEQFAYVASHDLQEPLRMVANYTQLLARRYKDKLDPTAHEFIAFAVDGANRMQRLINDLLDYSRVGTRGKEFTATDCSSVLGHAIANLGGAIESARALVTNDDLPVVQADAGQLMQLFQNLIGNAVKFHGQDPPRVHVSAQSRAGEWLFAVRDNGIGIEPEYAERIFVIFQRLHGFSEYPGTGIGLSICKKIVERHGGRIWVESKPGAGSTFYFTIPIRSERNQSEQEEREHSTEKPPD